LSLSVSCLFIPVDCWFIVFQNVGYRTMCKHKILCFAKHILQKHYKCLKKGIVRCDEKKCRFTGGMNIFVMVMRVSLMMYAVGHSQLRQTTKTLNILVCVCVRACVRVRACVCVCVCVCGTRARSDIHSEFRSNFFIHGINS
jgi:hypothetical protein